MGFEDFVQETKAQVKIGQENQLEVERREKDARKILSKTRDIFNHLPGIEEICDYREHTGDRSTIVGDSYTTPFVQLSSNGSVSAALVRDRYYKRMRSPKEGVHSHTYTLLIQVDGGSRMYARVEENDTDNNSRVPTIGYAEDRKHETYKLFVPGSEEQDKETVRLFEEACSALEEEYGPMPQPDITPKKKPTRQFLQRRKQEIQPTVPAGWSKSRKRPFFKKK